MERIFGVAWIYVGHESQVKHPGDFLATRIECKPLLLVRDGGVTSRCCITSMPIAARASWQLTRATLSSFAVATTFSPMLDIGRRGGNQSA
jgi:hypothetical protein